MSWDPLVTGLIQNPFKRLARIQVTGDGGSLSGFGIDAGLVVNSQSKTTNAGYLVQRVGTSTVSGNSAYLYSSNVPVTRYDHTPFYSIVAVPVTVSDARILFGFQSVVSFTDDPTTRHCAMFRFSTSASDTTWKCYTSNGSSSSVANSGVTVSTNTAYKMQIDMTSPTKIDFYIDGALVASSTTNLPGATTGLINLQSITTLTTAAATLDIGNLYLGSN